MLYLPATRRTRASPFARLASWRLISALAGGLILSGCASTSQYVAEEPKLQVATASLNALHALPPPRRPLHVAVYQFADQTGQHKPNESYADYSKAVTQGGTTILVNALREAGNGSWFHVLERETLPALLQERKLIRAARADYASQAGQQPLPLDPLLNAGVLLAGGIVSYDTNTMTGGLGARYLGIGGDIKYRRDNVSVYLRAVSVKSGEVLESVVVNKSIFSVGLRGGLFRYVGIDEILELEAGVSSNEPRQLALKQAIEKSLHTLIVRGARRNLWEFSDKRQQQELIGALERESAAGLSSTAPPANNR